MDRPIQTHVFPRTSPRFSHLKKICSYFDWRGELPSVEQVSDAWRLSSMWCEWWGVIVQTVWSHIILLNSALFSRF
jgi:hypothetical protein